jgi:hypothetical protein
MGEKEREREGRAELGEKDKARRKERKGRERPEYSVTFVTSDSDSALKVTLEDLYAPSSLNPPAKDSLLPSSRASELTRTDSIMQHRINKLQKMYLADKKQA